MLAIGVVCGVILSRFKNWPGSCGVRLHLDSASREDLQTSILVVGGSYAGANLRLRGWGAIGLAPRWRKDKCKHGKEGPK